MNTTLTLYRKRIIPEEIIPLKDDTILYADSERIITQWKTLKPRSDIAYGCSAYLLDKGYKISKIYDHEHKLVYWYCDIITHSYNAATSALTVIDLLVDVVIMSDGQVKVLDLDEVAEALEKKLISQHDACDALHKTNLLLRDIYECRFEDYQKFIECYEFPIKQKRSAGRTHE